MKRKVYRFYIGNKNCYVAIKASCEFMARLRFLLHYKQREEVI